MGDNLKLNKQSIADQIKEELKTRIVNVEIEQGEKLDLPKLEEEFEVSRAPVREALQSLADEGLVEVKPRVGYFAVELTTDQIEDICEMRKLIEMYSLKKSLHKIPRSEVEDIYKETLQLKKEELPKQELRERFDSTDEVLHWTLINNANNQVLENFAERIHNLIALTRHLNERIDEALGEHIEILESILEKDESRAKKSLQKHLNNVEKEILQ